MRLLPEARNSTAFVALSGGVDSMFLLHVLADMKKRGALPGVALKAIHINHGTRPGHNEMEEKLVRDFCHRLHVPVSVHRLRLGPRKNFEDEARRGRYAIFAMELGGASSRDGHRMLYTAHHIDDSYEWSMLQSAKSSNPQATLGIPTRKNNIGRPFMCLTKAQIRYWACKEKIPYSEDMSNFDLRHERNYLRQVVIPEIAARFPSYLSHYVSRSNILARKFALHLEGDSATMIRVYELPHGIVLKNICGDNNFGGAEELILAAIQKLSKQGRGRVRLQIAKLIQAAQNGRMGPVAFSGGVQAFLFYDSIVFVSQENLHHWQQLDQDLSKKLQAGARIPTAVNDTAHCKLRLLTIYQKELSGKLPLRPLKCVHPMFPSTTGWAIKNDFWLGYSGKLSKHWQKKGKKDIPSGLYTVAL